MSSVLFQCPDCGRDVSRTAKICPQCGNKKIRSQIRKKEREDIDPETRRRITKLLLVGGIAGIGISFFVDFEWYKPDPCECARILGVPTYQITPTGMPHPVDNVSDDEFKKYKECYDTYAGYAGASLECKK